MVCRVAVQRIFPVKIPFHDPFFVLLNGYGTSKKTINVLVGNKWVIGDHPME